MAKKKEPKFLKRSTVKGIKELSGEKVIKSMAQESSGKLVREVPSPYADPVQDKRGLFFKEAYKEAKRKEFGGFL